MIALPNQDKSFTVTLSMHYALKCLLPQHLVSIKCNPYHYGSKALILGDAAHAMAITVRHECRHGGLQPQMTIEKALQQFTEKRWRDAHAICDLAMYNYVEMRDLTKRFSFKCRKLLDTTLFRFFPNIWVPLYNSVSFTSMPYSKCIANRKWQDEFLSKTFYTILTSAFIVTSAVYWVKNSDFNFSF
ncbi:hypothetical protein DOY81_013111 [Sarcophaga bullata]|nr:hypothetical protein DOY81_013111 [Sarcophaga bullata]